jgi:2-keto-3-deoxy-6-phosphogluconate aldolase
MSGVTRHFASVEPTATLTVGAGTVRANAQYTTKRGNNCVVTPNGAL